MAASSSSRRAVPTPPRLAEALRALAPVALDARRRPCPRPRPDRRGDDRVVTLAMVAAAALLGADVAAPATVSLVMAYLLPIGALAWAGRLGLAGLVAALAAVVPLVALRAPEASAGLAALAVGGRAVGLGAAAVAAAAAARWRARRAEVAAGRSWVHPTRGPPRRSGSVDDAVEEDNVRARWGHWTGAEPFTTWLRALQSSHAQPACVFAFADAACDLAEIGAALASLGAPVIACTTAGQLGAAGLESGGVSVAVVDLGLSVRSFVVDSLADPDLDASAEAVAEAIRREGVTGEPGMSVFGLVLVDGLSGAEERLMAALHPRLPELVLVGGSAGDGARYQRTFVYHDGRFRTDAAVVHLVVTDLPVVPFKFQHHRASAERLVITAADAAARTVMEINGLPAAEAYARALGLPTAELTPAVAAARPLMLRLGDQDFIRSVQHVEADGRLRFFSAIDVGMVVRVGDSGDIVATMHDAFARARAQVGEPGLVIGCDCAVRRLEYTQAGVDAEIGAVLAANRVIGFSGYGEQYNGYHANQTFTGIMVGRRP